MCVVILLLGSIVVSDWFVPSSIGVHMSWPCSYGMFSYVELSTDVKLEVLVLRVGLWWGLVTLSTSCLKSSVPLRKTNETLLSVCSRDVHVQDVHVQKYFVAHVHIQTKIILHVHVQL